MFESILQKVSLKNSDELFYYTDFKQKLPSKSLYHSQDETFHQLAKIFLLVGQFFGAMPLRGITEPTSKSLKFTLWNVRVLYTAIVIIASLAVAVITFYWNTLRELKFENIVPVIWFSSNTFVMLEFIRVAKKWPNLMDHWEIVELRTTIRNEECHKTMKKWLHGFSVGIPIMALVEHLLSLANNAITAKSCKFTKDPMRAYFKQAFPFFYFFFEVNYLSGISLQLLNVFCTFIWSFTDNFIIIVSLGLITQFKHFNMYIEQFKGKSNSDDFWGKQRDYYNQLTNLLHHVNKDLNVIILISYSNNLFYICLQLYHSVTPSNSVIRSIYFWYSLVFLIGRTLLVSFAAANINDQAKRPIKVLRAIPTNCYKTEAQRFMQQISFDKIALSGMEFFHITRKFMLSITGTVITYELVLIQLQREPDTPYDPCEG